MLVIKVKFLQSLSDIEGKKVKEVHPLKKKNSYMIKTRRYPITAVSTVMQGNGHNESPVLMIMLMRIHLLIWICIQDRLPQDVLPHQLKFRNVLIMYNICVERWLRQQVGPGEGWVHQSVS